MCSAFTGPLRAAPAPCVPRLHAERCASRRVLVRRACIDGGPWVRRASARAARPLAHPSTHRRGAAPRIRGAQRSLHPSEAQTRAAESCASTGPLRAAHPCGARRSIHGPHASRISGMRQCTHADPPSQRPPKGSAPPQTPTPTPPPPTPPVMYTEGRSSVHITYTLIYTIYVIYTHIHYMRSSEHAQTPRSPIAPAAAAAAASRRRPRDWRGCPKDELNGVGSHC